MFHIGCILLAIAVFITTLDKIIPVIAPCALSEKSNI
jgi:hypothetical protein